MAKPLKKLRQQLHLLLLPLVMLFSMPMANADTIQLPDLGDSSVSTLSLSEERRLGTSTLRRMRAAGIILDDLEATAYIYSIMERMARAGNFKPSDYATYVLKSRDINAFALPGGFMGYNTGLVLASSDENELAAVVAHEITHVTQRHIARIMEATSGMGLLTAAGILIAILAGGNDPDIGQAAIGTALATRVQQQISHTREHEAEADRVGIQLMSQAGFEPLGMAGFFDRLDQQSRYYAKVPEILRTHPLSINRLTEARARARKYPDIRRPSSQIYYLMKERLRVLTHPQPHQLIEYYRAEKATNARHQLSMEYGRALALIRIGQPEKAEQILGKLADKYEDTRSFYLGLARAQRAQDKIAEARETYELAVAIFPRDGVVRFEYARYLLLGGHDANRAQELMAGLKPNSLTEHRHWQLQARLAADLNAPARAHLYMSYHAIVNGRRREAVKHLKAGLHTEGASEYDINRIEARLSELGIKVVD